jgi:hypothetical protein
MCFLFIITRNFIMKVFFPAESISQRTIKTISISLGVFAAVLALGMGYDNFMEVKEVILLLEVAAGFGCVLGLPCILVK